MGIRRRALIGVLSGLMLAPWAGGAAEAELDRVLSGVHAGYRGEAGIQLARSEKAQAKAKKSTPAEEASPEVAAAPMFQFLPLVPSASDTQTAPVLWPLLSSQKMSDAHEAVTRAVIFIHDADRNAMAGLTKLQELAGAVADGPAARTIIFAPLFSTAAEKPVFREMLGESLDSLALWPADGWVYGEDSQVVPPQQPVSSMLALDVLLLYLADQSAFPNLRDIVVAGGGRGGDFVQRYALVGRAPDIIAPQKIAVRYIVAAAQSYAYLTDARPTKDGGGFVPPPEAAVQACANYQDWPYGAEAPNAYVRQTAADVARRHYPERNIYYLYGAQDSVAAHDQHCGARLEGGSVKARAENYRRYLEALFPDSLTQHFIAMPGTGGDSDKIWRSNCGISVLFADGDCIRD